jgi:putative sigma-54 modulation protein
MKISISCKDIPLDEAAREVVTRRFQYALSRFDPEIHDVQIRGTDKNGPKGGIDKCCRVTVHLATGTIITVFDEDADFLVAASRAADRVGRSVARTVDRISKSRNGVSMSGLPSWDVVQKSN